MSQVTDEAYGRLMVQFDTVRYAAESVESTVKRTMTIRSTESISKAKVEAERLLAALKWLEIYDERYSVAIETEEE